MLRLTNIVKNYPTATTTVQALKGVSLSFRKHEFVAILGPSGCGKTTMLNIIGGLDRYTSGDLVIGGVSTAAFDDLHWDAYRNATIGFVFQSYNLIPHLTVLENVELSLCLVGKKKKERRAKAVQALRRVGMGDEINKRPNQLSGGQQQRVAIARAIVNDPKIILADEPTGALDSELSVQVMDILKEISETRLVIMVTHNAELANEYCSRICRFKDGQLISDSKPFTAEEEKEEVRNTGLEEMLSGDNVAAEGEGPVAEQGGLEYAEVVEEGDKNAADDAKSVAESEAQEPTADEATTDSVSLGEDAAKEGETTDAQQDAAAESDGKEPAIGDEDDTDYEHLFEDGEIEEDHTKKVSNRKRKKAMKKIGGVNKELFDDLGINSKTKKKKTPENKKDKTFKPTSMSPAMAFGLSLRNLISKKGRTIFTAIAGSIGIIGLGLVLSISNGFKMFVNNMKTDMMAGVPLGLYQYNIGVTELFDMMGELTSSAEEDEGAYPSGDGLTVGQGSGGESVINKLVSTFLGKVDQNNLSKEFVDYLDEKLEPEDYGAMMVFSGVRYNMVSKSADGTYHDISKQPVVSSVLSIATNIFGENGVQNEDWQMLVGDEDFMMKQYEFVGEGRYPQNKNELLLCVDSHNMVRTSTLLNFGIDTSSLPATLTAEDFVGREFRLIGNDRYYAPCISPETNYYNQGMKYYESIMEGITTNAHTWGYDEKEAQDKLEQVYNSYNEAEGDLTLKIVGVIRQKKGAQAKYVGSSICYTPELADYVTAEARKSQIVKDQQILFDKQANNEITGGSSANAYMTVFDTFLEDVYLSSDQSIIGIMGSSLALETYLKAIGYSQSPTFINIYPTTYEQKTHAAEIVNSWVGENNEKVGYLDVSEMLIYNLNLIIDLVTILLVAVAAISLVVSTAMIGVITSNSVIERIREIGILRSLGARKADIRNVFVAETSLIGLSSGIIGIVITYILCPLISLVIAHFAGVGSLMHFHPLHALALVALSLVLTVISGVIPAINASKKNVVDALRTN